MARNADDESPDLGTFAGRLKCARDETGLTQLELAVQAGFRPESISRWERGENEPELANARALAEALGCSIDWLVSGVGPRRVAGDIPEDVRTAVADYIREQGSRMTRVHANELQGLPFKSVTYEMLTALHRQMVALDHGREVPDGPNVAKPLSPNRKPLGPPRK
jgi:transcriptional regulator with XRE-family HTH domain